MWYIYGRVHSDRNRLPRSASTVSWAHVFKIALVTVSSFNRLLTRKWFVNTSAYRFPNRWICTRMTWAIWRCNLQIFPFHVLSWSFVKMGVFGNQFGEWPLTICKFLLSPYLSEIRIYGWLTVELPQFLCLPLMQIPAKRGETLRWFKLADFIIWSIYSIIET